MNKNYIKILIATASLICTNAWGVAIYCTDNQVAGTGTMVHDFYLDASDWSYGTLDPAVLFDGPNHAQVFSTYLSLIFNPGYLRYLMTNPEVGLNWSYGDGSTGILVPGPGGGYVAQNTPPPCSHPKYFPEPDITSFDFEPSSVYVGQKFKAFWITVGDPTSCNVDGIPGYPKQSILGEEFTATIGMDGSHTMICINDWGVSSPLYSNLTVNECIDPGTTYFVNSTVVRGTNPPGTALGYMDLNSPISIDTSAYCNGGYWKLRVTSAEQSVILHADIAGQGITQIDSDDIASASCFVLDDMKTTLSYYASYAVLPGYIGGYYDDEAVYAHENVHRNDFIGVFEPYYNTVRNLFESSVTFRIPIDDAANPAEAKSIITSHTQYNIEKAGLIDDEQTALNSIGHTNTSAFVNAQMNAISGYMDEIDSRLGSCP